MSGAAYYRIAFVIVMVPTVLLVISRPSALPPQPALPDATDVHSQMLSEITFNRRWQLIMPTLPAANVRGDRLRGVMTLEPSPVDAHDVVADTVPVAAVAPTPMPPPRHHQQARAEPKPRDVCAKHGMRKVYQTTKRGWKSWRCRK
jgi:hypothetical protein